MNAAFIHGNIITMNPECPRVQAVAWQNGSICCVGTDEQVLAAHPEWEAIDLNGRTVVPGLNDTHLHLLGFGAMMDICDVSGLESLCEVLKAIANFIHDRRIEPDEWVDARGFNQDLWAEHRIPDRYDLDCVSAEHPIRLTRVCGHMAVCNSKALEVLGITARSPAPPGGDMPVLNGMPTGVFLENAISMLYPAGNAASIDSVKRYIECAARRAAECGIVAVHSEDFGTLDGNYEMVIRAYRELEAEGRLPVRVYQQCSLPSLQAMDDFFAAGHCASEGCDRYRLFSIKLFADGSLGARTAFLSMPYADDPATRGLPICTQQQLDALVLAAHSHAMPVVVHAIGDAAINMVLDSIERARAELPNIGARHGVIHLQITDAQTLDRFRTLDVEAYAQPIFLEYDLHIVEGRVGRALAQTSYNWKTLIDLGVNISGGSDCPVESLAMLPNLYAAVTRKDLNGYPEAGWLPEQRLSAMEALQMFTVNAAKAAGEQDRRGSIAVGKLADFTVLEQDILQIDPDAIKDVKVCATVVGGDFSYRSGV